MQGAYKKIQMRDKTHMEHVERWARFVRDNPTKWKASHTAFINAVYEKAAEARERIAKLPDGKEKLAKLREMRLTNHARRQL